MEESNMPIYIGSSKETSDGIASKGKVGFSRANSSTYLVHDEHGESYYQLVQEGTQMRITGIKNLNSKFVP